MDARLQILRRQTERPARISPAMLDALDRGEASLSETFSLAPSDIELLRERGLAFLDVGLAEKAKAVFELILLLEGEDPGTTLLLASCHLQLGNVAAASAFLACVLDPNSGASPDLVAAAQDWSAALLPRKGAAR